jgi:anti-anti-sigma factor
MSTAESIGSLAPTTAATPLADPPRLEVVEGTTPEPVQHFSIVIGRRAGTVVVNVHGDLDMARAGQLGNILVDLIDGQGNLSIVVDLHDATTSDPDSLSVFVDAAERARRRGGSVEVDAGDGLELRGLDHFVGLAGD